jgi:exodeoxyribonuclease VII small subunit
MTLEQKLERLDVIVTELENDKIDLASALALFEEGVKCLRDAAASLTEAETRVKKLTEQSDGTLVLEDLDDDA